MLRAQQAETREISGLLTNTGRVIILPSGPNGPHRAVFRRNMYGDAFGRPSVWFGQASNGNYEVTLYYYRSPSPIPSSVQTHTIIGTIHTHPLENGYDWDNPSGDDRETARELNELSHYVFHKGTAGFFKYDQNGNRTTVEQCGVRD
jgi:hypothetical protein